MQEKPIKETMKKKYTSKKNERFIIINKYCIEYKPNFTN